MKRRQFIAGLGSAVAWPLVARAQQPQRMRRIGVLMNLASDDPESANRAAALAQGLAELGWTVGRNVQIVYRWGGDDIDRIRALAQELVGLRPDSFAGVTDPVARGIVARLDRPSGNITGFANYEAT
jgi:putative tryptophan/tyrosine transport system substrate-binding protein